MMTIEEVVKRLQELPIIWNVGDVVTLNDGQKLTYAHWQQAITKPEPYQFRAGDVVEVQFKYPVCTEKRIIVEHDKGKLISVGPRGHHRNKGQDNFEYCGYRKIGELKDYLKG